MKRLLALKHTIASGLFVGLLLLPSLAEAQFRNQYGGYVRLAARYTTSELYSEPAVLPTADGKGLLVTTFRIPNDLLVFMKNQEVAPGREFVASLVVTAEVYRERQKVAEDVWIGEHFAATYDQTRDRALDVEGQLTFTLEPGRYVYRLRIADDNSDREASLPPIRVEVPAYGTLGVGRALMVSDWAANADRVRLELVNLDGNAPYGSGFKAILPIGAPDGTAPEAVDVQYTLRKLDENDLERESRERRRAMEQIARERRRADGEPAPLVMLPELQLEGGDAVDPDASAAELLGVRPAEESAVEAGRITLEAADGPAGAYLAVLDLGGRDLENGTYVLEARVKVGDETAESRTRFTTHWRNMPISLNDIDVAIENLEFLIGRGPAKDLRKGKRSEKIERFRAFWKERDPTPGTEFNELMAEYYRRIDYAAFEYRTGGEPVPNGLETDRAKVYVLNGPPDSVERDFPRGGGVREVWAYDDGKRFVFEASSSVDEFKIVDSD